MGGVTPYGVAVRESAGRMLRDGASVREVARTLGVHHKTVSRWFPGAGWSKREGGEFRAWMRSIDETVLRG